MKYLSKLHFLLPLFVGLFMASALIPAQVVAQDAIDVPNIAIDDTDPFGTEQVREDLGTTLGDNDLITTVTGIIRIGLGLLGLLAVIIVLVGGFRWMTAGGSPEKVDAARKVLISGVIGIAIILSAYTLAEFVISSMLQATGAGGSSVNVDN